MRRKDFRSSCALVSSMFAAAFASGAHAQGNADGEVLTRGQTTLEDIVVTARRREESLQSTPVAVTAISTQTLEERNVINMEDISRITPNFTIFETSGGLGAASLYMRGIGYSDTLPGQDSPIAIYSDGVLMGRNGTAMLEIVEPERIEVLRGPQGTLFGRNTTAGAILITTHEPDDEANGMVKTSYGRFDSVNVQARLDTGLLGNSGLKLSLAYGHRERDGTFNDIDEPDDRDPGARVSNSYWGKLVGDWDDFRLMITGDSTDLKGRAAPLQVVVASPEVLNFIARSPSFGGGSYVVTQTPQFTLQDGFVGLQRVESRGISMTLDWDVSDNIALKSISALRSYERSDPAAYGPGNLVGPTPGGLASFEGLYALPFRIQDQKQRSQEFQILGSYGNFDFVAGAYYYYEFAEDANFARLPFILPPSGNVAIEFIAPREFTAKTESLAAFLQANWRPNFFDNKLELTGGIRYTDDKKRFEQVEPLVRNPNFSSDDISFLVSANYQITPDAMVYLRYSTGYRSGGLNARAPASLDPTFEPEKIKAVEAGFKVDLLDNRLRINGAAFYNDYSNLQVGAFVPPSGGQIGGNIAVNANAKYKGLELEAQLVPVEGLNLRAVFGYVDPEYTEYPRNLIGGAVSQGCDPIVSDNGMLVGQDCADVAKFLYFSKTNVDLSATYTIPVGSANLSFHGSYTYRGPLNFSAFDDVQTPYQDEIAQDGYSVVNARIALSDIPISNSVTGQIAIFGDNLTNEIYSLQSIDFRSYGTKYFSTRRTWGVEGKINF